MLLSYKLLTFVDLESYMKNRVVQKKLFFKFNPSSPQIVRLVIEAPHTKFQLIRFTGRWGHAIWIFEVSSKNSGFFAHFGIIFLSQNTWYLDFFWFNIAQISYYTQSITVCSVCVAYLKTKNFSVFSLFWLKYVKVLMPSRLLSTTNTALQTTA